MQPAQSAGQPSVGDQFARQAERQVERGQPRAGAVQRLRELGRPTRSPRSAPAAAARAAASGPRPTRWACRAAVRSRSRRRRARAPAVSAGTAGAGTARFMSGIFAHKAAAGRATAASALEVVSNALQTILPGPLPAPRLTPWSRPRRLPRSRPPPPRPFAPTDSRAIARRRATSTTTTPRQGAPLLEALLADTARPSRLGLPAGAGAGVRGHRPPHARWPSRWPSAARSWALSAGWVRLFDNVHWTHRRRRRRLARAGSACATRARRACAPSAAARRWFALGFTSYAIGQALWDLQIFLAWQPFPAPSDPFYMMMAPCCALGMMGYLRGRVQRIAAAGRGAGHPVAGHRRRRAGAGGLPARARRHERAGAGRDGHVPDAAAGRRLRRPDADRAAARGPRLARLGAHRHAGGARRPVDGVERADAQARAVRRRRRQRDVLGVHAAGRAGGDALARGGGRQPSASTASTKARCACCRWSWWWA